jgi:hypothetical protein
MMRDGLLEELPKDEKAKGFLVGVYLFLYHHEIHST